jgi:hypothetical protein
MSVASGHTVGVWELWSMPLKPGSSWFAREEREPIGVPRSRWSREGEHAQVSGRGGFASGACVS